MDHTISKPDIFKEAIINSSIFIDHAKTCKKCLQVLCNEAKVLFEKQKEISDKARNTEEQLIIEIREKEVIPEGYYEVLMMFYECIKQTNITLSDRGYVGWEGLDDAGYIVRLDNGDEYCKWDIARNILSNSILVPTTELNIIFDNFDEANKKYFGLKKYIEAEDEYREHVKECKITGNNLCDTCDSLFKDAELIRITVLDSIGSDILWNRYKNLERFVANNEEKPALSVSLDEVVSKLKEEEILSKVKNIKPAKELQQNPSNVVEMGLSNTNREIDNFLAEYESLLSENEKLRQHIEVLQDSVFPESAITDEQIKKHLAELKESNKNLRERNNKLLEACKVYSQFTLTSRDLLLSYVTLGVSDLAIKYNEELKEVSKYLLYHLSE
jgi:hypothetical protein